MPQFVLVHGGSVTAGYFDLLRPLLNHASLAVNLPGRADRPADINRVTISDWVESVVADIRAAAFDEVILVGNSLAGITIPGVAAGLPETIRHIVFSSCTVPAHGQKTWEVLRPDIRDLVGSLEETVVNGKLQLDAGIEGTDGLASAADCLGEDAPRELLDFLDAPGRRQFPEALAVFFERFSWEGFPRAVPRTYVKNWRDVMVPPVLQDVMIGNMGGANVINLDSPHCPEVRYPEVMACLLNGIAASLYQRAGQEGSPRTS